MTDETEPTLRLTRRRALAGLLTIGAGSAAAGAGTFALFSDTETSDGNTISAGTLDLDLSDGSADSSLSVTANPGDAGYLAFELTNTGTIDGYLDVSLVENTSTEGGDEFANDDSDGEIENYLNIWAYIEGEYTGSAGVSTGSTYDQSGDTVVFSDVTP